MPGATTARLVVWLFEMPMKLSMMPQTVPNRPTKGAVAPMVAMIAVPRAILRPACASSRDRSAPTRSLTPSAGSPAERSSSPAAARTKRATGVEDSAKAFCAAGKPEAAASVSRSRRAARRAVHRSMLLASQMVQVTREAKASPVITICTMKFAWRNMPHGDRLLGTAEGREPCPSTDGRGAATGFSCSVGEAVGFAAEVGARVGAGEAASGVGAGDGAAASGAGAGDGAAASGACARADDASTKLNPIAARSCAGIPQKRLRRTPIGPASMLNSAHTIE